MKIEGEAVRSRPRCVWSSFFGGGFLADNQGSPRKEKMIWSCLGDTNKSGGLVSRAPRNNHFSD